MKQTQTRDRGEKLSNEGRRFLNELRCLLGLTMEALAKLANVSLSSVRRVLTQPGERDESTIQKICSALGTHLTSVWAAGHLGRGSLPDQLQLLFTLRSTPVDPLFLMRPISIEEMQRTASSTELRMAGNMIKNIGWTLQKVGQYGDGDRHYQRASEFLLGAGDHSLALKAGLDCFTALNPVVEVPLIIGAGNHMVKIFKHAKNADKKVDPVIIARLFGEIGKFYVNAGLDSEARPRIAKSNDIFSKCADRIPDMLDANEATTWLQSSERGMSAA